MTTAIFLPSGVKKIPESENKDDVLDKIWDVSVNDYRGYAQGDSEGNSDFINSVIL